MKIKTNRIKIFLLSYCKTCGVGTPKLQITLENIMKYGVPECYGCKEKLELAEECEIVTT